MQSTLNQVTLKTASSLEDFFRAELSRAVDSHQVDISEDTQWYLTQLLYNYRRSDRFFDYHANGGTLTPLAEYYRHAAEASSTQEQRLHLQRLGDVSLFVSSLFAGALRRKPVNVNYYMSMGETAYGYLADTSGQSSRDRALVDIFADLSNRFCQLVIAIGDIGLQNRDGQNLLQMVLEWEKTQCPALAKRLEARGVVLSISERGCH